MAPVCPFHSSQPLHTLGSPDLASVPRQGSRIVSMMKLPPDVGGILIRHILQMRMHPEAPHWFSSSMGTLNASCTCGGVRLRDESSTRYSHHGHSPDFSHNRIAGDGRISAHVTRGLWDFGSESSVTRHTSWEDDDVPGRVAYAYTDSLGHRRLPG